MLHVPPARLPAASTASHPLRSLRIYKFAQLLWLFYQGGRTVKHQFPAMGVAQKRQAMQQWAQRMLQVLQIEVDSTVSSALAEGALPASLVVSNHLSWLDILVIQSLLPGVFVAKNEVRRWPLIGPLAQACATIFVDRSSTRSAHGMVDQGVGALRQGWSVVAFPEGTSSDGADLGPFHANIFECAIRHGTPVQPLTLRYIDRRSGQTAPLAHFTGDTTLLASLLRITGQSSLCAQVQAGEPIAVAGHTRRTLARSTHQHIRALLLACTLLGTGVAATAQDQDLTPPIQKEAQVLNFRDFFQQPMGTHGMEITDTLRRADGQRMRITGYMVQQETPAMGRFMLTPRPVRMSEHADGDADDLPAAWVMVYLDPSQSNFAVPHVRGLVEISGLLSVGRYEEADGRVSWIRLQLDPEATRGMNPFEVSNYLHSLQHVH